MRQYKAPLKICTKPDFILFTGHYFVVLCRGPSTTPRTFRSSSFVCGKSKRRTLVDNLWTPTRWKSESEIGARECWFCCWSFWIRLSVLDSFSYQVCVSSSHFVPLRSFHVLQLLSQYKYLKIMLRSEQNINVFFLGFELRDALVFVR